MIFKKGIFTIPNLLTFLRLALIPVYTSIYLDTENAPLAAVVLAVSCATDLLDGMIARRFHMVSNLGKFLDPLADKITQLTVLLCLSTRYALINALIPLFIVKECMQSALAYFHFRKGKTLGGALWAGKFSTAYLFVSLILLMALPHAPIPLVKFIVVSDAIFLLISLTGYLNAYLKHTEKLCDT